VKVQQVLEKLEQLHRDFNLNRNWLLDRFEFTRRYYGHISHSQFFEMCKNHEDPTVAAVASEMFSLETEITKIRSCEVVV
jgi:hypothetical protein